MNLNIPAIKERIAEAEPESVMEMLYEFYREINRPEPEEIKAQFSHLNDILSRLPLREMDEVWYRICDLCTAYLRMGYLDGLGMGAKLMKELEEYQ